MSDYYYVTVTMTLGVLASSQAEAEEVAKEYTPLPENAYAEFSAQKGEHQNDTIKKYAVNK